MSDAAQPGGTEVRSVVRSAADSLKRAIDDHLAAVAAARGEDDERVLAAYQALAEAADAYDEVLYETYDEVTPFELPDLTADDSGLSVVDPEAVSVLIRRDYLVADPERLRRQAALLDADGLLEEAEADGDHEDAGDGDDAEEAEDLEDMDVEVDAPVLAGGGSRPLNGAALPLGARRRRPSVRSALTVVFGECDPDDVAARCEEFGLEEADSTLWVCATEPAESGEWLAEPFDSVSERNLVCRFDTGFDLDFDED